jgi:hypothetical protein
MKKTSWKSRGIFKVANIHYRLCEDNVETRKALSLGGLTLSQK